MLAPLRPAHPMIAFGVLATTQFVLIAAITVLSVALPAIQRDLHLATGQLALVSASYGLSFSGLLVLGGRLGDQFGHRRLLIAGLSVFCLASAAVGLATGLWILLAARFTQGIGAALAAPAAMALLGAIFPEPGQRERIVAVWGTVASLGATAGTLLSGAVISVTSWRWLFVLLIMPAALALTAVFWTVPQGDEPRPRRLDLAGAALVTAGLTALSYGLIRSSDNAWISGPVLLPMAAGGVALGAFLVVEQRSRAALIPLAFLAEGRRAVALASVLLGSAAMSTIFFFLALQFQQVRGYSPLATSMAFLPFAAVLLATGVTSGRVVAGLGAGTTTALGLALAGAGLLFLGRLTVGGGLTGPLLLGLLIFPAGAALTFAGATVTAVTAVSADSAGLAAGVVNTALEIGPTVGLAVLVSVAGKRTALALNSGIDGRHAATTGYAFAFAATGLAALTLAVIALAVLGRRRSETT